MSLRTRAVVGLSLAVAATGFYAQPASANLAGTGLVISEVYGAGGNSGALYNADFVEIFNPTDAVPRPHRHVGPVPQRDRCRHGFLRPQRFGRRG